MFIWCLVDSVHVVRGQHPPFTGSLDRSLHPAFIDWLTLDDEVILLEGEFVRVG